MDYLQYPDTPIFYAYSEREGFKPYYKWITFNTKQGEKPLSLLIAEALGFKPYYKWITFNTGTTSTSTKGIKFLF